MSQQVLEQAPAKAPVFENSQNHAYRPSAWPAVFSTTSKVLYGLGGLSAIASVGIWNRVSFPRRAPKGKKITAKPATREQYQEAQRLGTFVGLLAPSFFIAGKALHDASVRMSMHEMARWEKEQAAKARGFRLFSR